MLNYPSDSTVLRGLGGVSFVTGAHQFRSGVQWHWANSGRINANDTAYTFVNGSPAQVTYAVADNSSTTIARSLGLYAQDRWQMHRLTLNGGLRLDYLNTRINAAHVNPGKYWSALDFPAIDNVPNWKDVTVRLGASLDVFGNGRTALKWNAGKYLEAMQVTFADAVNPLITSANQVATRNWNDNTGCATCISGDFVPQEGELGAISNPNFATSNVGIRYDPAVATGWGKRAWNWETSISVQHQLLDGLSVDAGYYRRWRGNFRVTDNLTLTPADYDPFCVTAPNDSRLPNGGGYSVCGLYDINPAKFNATADNVVTSADHFGKQTEVFNSVDIAISARLSRTLTLQGGTSTGRVETNSCFIVDSPQSTLNCNVKPPFQTQSRIVAIYRTPFLGLRTSLTFQSNPGPQILATWSAPASAVTGLGRALAGSARNVLGVPLIAPGTIYGERTNQMDFRLARDIKLVGRLRVEGQFDVYNVLNEAYRDRRRPNLLNQATAAWA